jgi:hypothetical protein
MALDGLYDAYMNYTAFCQKAVDQAYFTAIRPGLSGFIPFFIAGYFWRGPIVGFGVAIVGVLVVTFYTTIMPELAANYL